VFLSYWNSCIKVLTAQHQHLEAGFNSPCLCHPTCCH